MDSLTQLALGAAVGEAVAGKKLGNKAMLWGALAGTIPDLDIITGLWMDDIESMAFHRGITHSIVFSILFPILCAGFARWYYNKKPHNKKAHERFWQTLWTILGVILIGGPAYLFLTSTNTVTGIVLAISAALGIYWIWRSFKHPFDDFEPISFTRWYVFFFLAFVTHIAIDAFTTYGTQIFQPFSNYRFTTSTISVADPAYTIPLLSFLTISSLFKRRNPWRSRLNNIGLILSSLYMIFTFFNKSRIDHLFQSRLADQNIKTERFMTNPTILNNILWHGIAETDTAYIEGYYSLFDSKAPFEDIRILPKNRSIIKNTDCATSGNLATLRWFSDGYYNFSIVGDTVYYNDLRFGTIWMDDVDKPDKQVFYFHIDEKCDAHEIRDTDDIGEAWDVFVSRVKGE